MAYTWCTLIRVCATHAGSKLIYNALVDLQLSYTGMILFLMSNFRLQTFFMHQICPCIMLEKCLYVMQCLSYMLSLTQHSRVYISLHGLYASNCDFVAFHLKSSMLGIICSSHSTLRSALIACWGLLSWEFLKCIHALLWWISIGCPPSSGFEGHVDIGRGR
jgi:hypothetical protein